MSKKLYVIIEFNPNISLEVVSNESFKIIEEASKRNLALYRIRMRAFKYDYLKDNEMYIEISNSYVFNEAEKILLDDYSIPFPSHIDRLNKLQGLLEFIYNLEIVNKVSIYMCDDDCIEDDFELVNCNLSNFSNKMKEKLYQQISYAYKCVYQK